MEMEMEMEGGEATREATGRGANKCHVPCGLISTFPLSANSFSGLTCDNVLGTSALAACYRLITG